MVLVCICKMDHKLVKSDIPGTSMKVRELDDLIACLSRRGGCPLLVNPLNWLPER